MSEIFSNVYLPDSWVWAKSKEIGFVINGDRGKNYPSRQHYISSGIPFLSAGNLSEGSIDLDSLNFISEDKFNALNSGKLQKGDIIYCLRGTLGKSAAFELDKNAAIASSLAILRPSELINKRYLLYFLQGPFGSKLVKHFDNGTAQPNLSGESFSNYDFPISPLPEQHRIVAKIEELFSSLDKGIESLKTAQAQLKTYRQAILKWAFEGKLTNENVKEGELPEGWKIYSLKEICNIIGGVTKGRDFKGKPTTFLPYLRVANVQDGYLNLNEIKTIEALPMDLDKYRLLYGDILYTEGGDKDKLGRGTIWKNEIKNCIHQNHIFRARLISSDYEPKYVALFSQTKTAKDYFYKNGKQTTNLASINLTILSTLPVTLPPTLLEQNRIVSEIESRFSVCDKLEESITQSLVQAEALRQSILKKAFEGKLVPQDPNDEPASVLLERIRTERMKNMPDKKTRSKKVKK